MHVFRCILMIRRRRRRCIYLSHESNKLWHSLCICTRRCMEKHFPPDNTTTHCNTLQHAATRCNTVLLIMHDRCILLSSSSSSVSTQIHVTHKCVVLHQWTSPVTHMTYTYIWMRHTHAVAVPHRIYLCVCFFMQSGSVT